MRSRGRRVMSIWCAVISPSLSLSSNSKTYLKRLSFSRSTICVERGWLLICRRTGSSLWLIAALYSARLRAWLYRSRDFCKAATVLSLYVYSDCSCLNVLMVGTKEKLRLGTRTDKGEVIRLERARWLALNYRETSRGRKVHSFSSRFS